MEYKSIWQWLGIEPTNNIDEIKQAYSKQAKVYHPEEHPTEFQMLRNAYRTAMKRAKKPHSVVMGDLRDKPLHNESHGILTKEIEMELMSSQKQQASQKKEKTDENQSEQLPKQSVENQPKQCSQQQDPQPEAQEEQPVRKQLETQPETQAGTQPNPQPEEQAEQPAEYHAEIHSDKYLENKNSSEMNLDYNVVYQQLWMEKKEEYLQQVLTQIRKLRKDTHGMNQIAIWKSILEQKQSRVLYNPKDFTAIIKAVLWGNMNAEIYSYLYSLADSFEWNNDYISYKESLKNYYEYVLNGKSSEIAKHLESKKKMLKEVMQQMDSLAHNGVGKDNINLWKNIIEYGNVDQLYNPEDFGKILRFIISQDQLNTNVLVYFSNRAEMVAETSISYQQACEALKKKVEQRNIKEIYVNKNIIRMHQQPRKAKLTHKESTFKGIVIFFIIMGTIGILQSASLHNSGNNDSEQEIQTINVMPSYSTYDLEEQQEQESLKQEQMEEIKNQMQSMYDWYSNNDEEETTNGSDRN